MLVTLEGLDGCGKTTVWRTLKERYPDAVFTKEPTESWYGDAVRRSVRDPEADPIAELFLYCADHAAHVTDTIEPALAAGKLVVSDRYVDSRLAYQGSILADRIDYSMGFVRTVHDPFTMMPDLTIYLDIDVPTAVDRSGGESKFEHEAFLADVKDAYERLIEEEPERFVVIDATADATAVAEEVEAAIAERLT